MTHGHKDFPYTIHISHTLGYHPVSPLVNIGEDYGPDKITVSLWWTQEIHDNLLVSYSISILPMVGVTITMISNTRANLTLSYNTLYNMSVMADFCG